MPVSNSVAPLPTLRRFTSARAGLAYEFVGTGDPALLVIPGLVSHIDYDLSRPEVCSFYQRLAGRRRLIRYDKRGCGLSDRTGEVTWPGICRAPGWNFWRALITCPTEGTRRRSPTSSTASCATRSRSTCLPGPA